MGGRGSKGIGSAVSFGSYSEADSFFGGGGANQEDWQNGLSQSEKDAIKDYTLVGYARINPNLRRDGYDNSEQSTKKEADRLQGALDKYELNRDILVYRGVSQKFLGGYYSAWAINNSLVGQSFTDNGFASCSTVQGRAFTFRDYILEIKVPRGKGRGAYISPVSTFKAEAEFLLSRGTNFKITGARDEAGKTIIEVVVK